ncbi:hypothetical protein C5Z26_09030 [Lactobacillus sp. CBA3606]|uniref:hypothetical protein n=1 Tax=Lactobacillus sp. CBA3606 TaxID=2099789 RepID=UPI000CFD7E89|nr:hypothetical protein [Lactobacillus sp. CBA3606]AVK64246.1 hypothetical protein C5Z26_09030 [Lactobacillus sp. CBA3606]
MNLVVGPFLRKTRAVPKVSMYTALERVDQCLKLITNTGAMGLTNSTATLGLNLTHLLDANVVVTSNHQTFNIIIQVQTETLVMTGCIIKDAFHNMVNPMHPTYLISLDRQLIVNSDDLIEAIYTHL